MSTQAFLRKTQNILAHHRRRARAAGVTIDYDLEALRSLAHDALATPCPHCGIPLTEESFTLDHVTPTSRHGAHALENLEVICKRCNDIKGKLTGLEYAAILSLLADFPLEARADVLRRLRAGGNPRRG